MDGQIVFLMDVHLQENLSQSYKVAARYVVQKSINKKREQEPECHGSRWTGVGWLKMQKVFGTFCVLFLFREQIFWKLLLKDFPSSA